MLWNKYKFTRKVQYVTISPMAYSLVNTLIDLVFPSTCLSCSDPAGKNALCGTCMDKIRYLAPARQTKMAAAAYDALFACAAYEEPVKTLIHLFKYRNYEYLYKTLSFIMKTTMIQTGLMKNSFTVIAHVPSHPVKLRERGYNPSFLLARSLSGASGIPFDDTILVCTQKRPSQTSLNTTQRRTNVEGVFTAVKSVKDMRLLLVDDVVTTGATMADCARALKMQGASSVTALALAKTA